ncbi:toxin glutamine deamidase domain-containing protein [Nocardia sp. NPDC058519]|uniref:toxin glutamine deamidase domain-containing protein n=1 Tax=Nocardia sp. NPDC058519 TaxID=3346535 RepID=UPI003662C002
MAIWRPPFAGALSWVAGVQWPEGNEDAMWAMAQDLEAAATQAREAIQDVIALSNATEVVYPSGRGGDAMRTWLEQFQGEDGSLEKLALSYEELADSADKFGTELQATKLNYHAGLMWFVAEMAVAALMGPGGLAYQSTVIAMARTFFQRVARAALQRMAALAGKQLSKAAAERVGIIAGALLYETVQESLEEVFQGTAQEYGIQRFQVSQGHLDQVDGAKVWQNAKISAVAGAAGGLTGGILNSAATKPVGKWAAAGQGAAIGATAGTAGGAAAYVATGLDTNNWEFDPRSITSGAISGTGPGAINGYQNAGDGSSSRTAPAPTTTSPAPGPDTRTSDAPGGSKAAPASTTEPATRESDAPQTSTPPSPTITNNSPAVSSATTNTTTNTPSATNNNAPAPTRAPTVGTTSTTSNSTSTAAQSSSTNSTTSAPTTTAAQSATSATNSPDTTPLSAASTGTTAAAIDTATTSATNADVEATTSQPAEPASTVPVPDTTDPADVSPAVVEADAAVAQPDSVPPVDIQPADSTSPAPVTPVTEPATPHAPDTNSPLTNLSSTTPLSTAIPAAISTPGPTRASETRPPTTPRPEPGATSTPDTEAVAIEHASVSENDTTTDVSEAATHRAADIDNPEPVGGRGLDTAVVQARATASTEAPATRVPVETEQRGADPTNTVPDTARTDPAARATAANEPSSRPRTTEAPDVAAGPTTENTARTDSPTYDARLPSGEGVRHRPTGTAVGEDPHTHRATQNLSNDGAHDVVVHGRADGLPMPGKRVPVHPQEIVDAIRANPHYRPGTPVRLVSCHAANGWAQYVADQLGVVVTAPTDRVGVPREPNSAPVIDNGGRWRTFRPQRADETPSNSEEFTQQPTRDHADAATTQPESGRTDWMSDGPPRAPAATQLRPPPGMTELPEPGVDARLLGSLDLSDPSVTTDDGDPPAITHIDGEHVDDFSRRLSAERGAAYVRAAEVDPAVTAAYEAAKATAARLAAEQAAAGVGVRTAKDALRAAETTLRDATEQQRPAAEENVRAAQSSMRSAIESAKQAKQALHAFESTDQSATAKTEYEQAKKATLPAARRGNVTAITIDRLTGRVYEAANGPSTYTIHPDMLHRALYDNVALRQDPGEVHTNPDHTAFPHADHPLGHAEIRTTNAAVHDRELLNSTPEHAGRYPTDHDGLASILNSPFVPRIAEEAPCCANCTRVLIGTESTAGHIIDEGAPRVDPVHHADLARDSEDGRPRSPRLVSTVYPEGHSHRTADDDTDWMSDDSAQPDRQPPDDSGDLTGPSTPDHATPHVPTNSVVRERLRTLSRQITAAATEQHSARRQLSTLAQELGIDPGRSGPRTLADEIRSASQARIDTAAQVYEQRPSTPDDMVRHIYRRHAAERTIDALAALNNRAERQLDRYLQARTTESELRAEAGRRAVADILTAAGADVRSEGVGVVPGRPPHALAVSTTDPHSLLDDSRRRELQDAGIGVEYHRVVIDDAGNVHVFDLGSSQNHTTPPRIPGPETTLGDHYRAGDRALETARQRAVEQLEDAYRRVVGETRPESPLRRDPAVSQRIDQARAEALERLRQTHQAMATELDTATREALGRLGEPTSTPAPDPAPSQAPVPAARTGTRARLRRIVTGVRERIAEWNQAVATAKHPSGSGLDGKGQNELFHTPFRVSAQTEHRNPGEKEAFADVQAPNIARILHEAAVLYKNRELLWRNYVGWTEASSDTPPTRRSDGTPYRYWNEGAVENADDQEFVRLEAERTAAIWRQVTRPAGTDPDSRAELDQVAVEQNPELARRLQRAAAPATDALFAETNPVDPTQLTPEARAAYADALRHATLLRRQAEALDLTLTDLGPAGLRQAAAELHARNVRLAGAIDAAVDTWQRFRGEDARLPFTRDVDITRNNSGSRLLREIAGEQASFVDRSVANPANMGSGPEFSTPQDEAVWQAEAARRTSLRNEAAAWAAYLDVDDVAALDDVRTQEQVLRDRLAADIRQSADFVRRSEQYLRVQARLDALTDVDRAPVAPIDPPARLDPAELALPNDIDLAVVELAGRLGIDRAALDPARIRETLEALRRDNIIRAGRVEALAALAHHQVAWAAAVAANKSESEHNQPMPVVEPGRLFPVPNRIDSDAFLRAIAGGHDIATALNSARTTIDPNADWLRFALVYDTDLKSHEVDVVAAVVQADIAVLTDRLAQLETGATTPDSARTADRLRAEIARRHDWLDTLRATTSKPDADRITRTHQEIRAEIVRRAAEIEALADLTTRAGPSPHRADPAVGPNAAPTGHPLAETARRLVDRFSATATTIVEHFEQLAHTLDAQAETTLSNDAAWESTGPARSHVATTPEVAADLADLANRVEHAATQRDSAADALRARARDLGLDPDIRGPRQAWQAITDHLGPRRAAARQVLDRGAGTVSEHLDARAVIDAAQRHQQAADQLMFDYLRARDHVEDLRTQLLARAAADVLEAAGALDHHAGVGTVPAPTAQVLAVTGDSDPHRRTLSANDHRRLLAANVAVTFQRVLVGERGEVHVVELRLRGGNDPTAGPIGDPRVPPPGPVNLAGPATEQGHPDPTTRPDSTERQANPSTPENITRGLLPDFNRVDYEFSVNPVQAHEDPELLQQMEALLTTPSGGFETHFDPRTHPAARHVNGEGPDGPGRLNNCGWAAMAGMSTFFGDPRVAPRMLPVLGPNGTAVYQGGLDREYISRWLGTGWLQFDPAMSIEDQYRALHDLVAELGPGTAVYVATRWQRLDQDGNRVFRPDGSARLTGGHATLVVYPRDADTPVWWDTQELTATDRPPAKMLREAGTLQVGIVRADGSIFDPTDAADHRIAATQSWTALPSTDPVLRTMHATLSDEQLRGASPTPSEQPPDLTTAPDLGTESPAIATPGFDITNTVDTDGNPVTSLTLRIHLQQTGDITPGEMGRVRASTQLALTEIFGASAITEPSHALEPAAPHTPLQLPTGARLQVRVEFVDQPGAAHLRTPVSRIAGLIPHGWAPDATPTELAEQIRDHFGLQPHNNTHDQGLSLDGMELYELRDEISHRITAANTRCPLPAIADARVLGFHPPVALEQQHYQEDLRAAALEGDHYVSGFDPRRHPVADLVNDGGTTRGGRESNCWETSVAAITTFFGDPHVARAALAVPGRNGVPEYRAIGDDSAIRQWLGADSIDFSHTGSDITEHFDRLHDLIAEIGPGSAAFVGITWQGDGQEPGGRHMMVIVHPTDGSGPIWWDPQSRKTWDRAPAQVVRKTAVLTAIPLLPDGSPYRVATDTHRSPSQGIHHPEPPTGPSPRDASIPTGLGSNPDRTGPHPATGTPGIRSEFRDRLHLQIPELGNGSRDRELSANTTGGRATAGQPDLSLPHPNTPAPERGQTGPGVVPDAPGIADRTGTDRARVPADRVQEQPSVSPDDLPRRAGGSQDPVPVRDRGELATAPDSRLLTDNDTASPDKPFTLNLAPDRPGIAEAHARYGTETVAGVAHHADDSDLNDLAQRVRRDDNYFTADVHLSDDGEAIIGGHRYTAEEYGDLLRQHTSWDGTTPVRLVGCDGAVNDFAARLATHLGTDVLAPTEHAWTDGHGRVYTSSVEIGPDGNPRPRIPPDGHWMTCHPDGTVTRTGLDGFVPGTPDADRRSPDPSSARDRGKKNRNATEPADSVEHADQIETSSTRVEELAHESPPHRAETRATPTSTEFVPATPANPQPSQTVLPAESTEQSVDDVVDNNTTVRESSIIAPDLSAIPPLGDFIYGSSDSELLHTLSAMNGRYGPFDVRIDEAEYQDVDNRYDMQAQFKVIASVHDTELGKVGIIKYFIYADHNGKLALFHQLIKLDPIAQGRRFSEHYTNAMNEYYLRSHIHRVEIQAALDGGGYAWARRGFDFDPDPKKLKLSVSNIKSRIGAIYDECSQAERSQLDEILERFSGDISEYPRPIELANLAGDDGKLGKRLMRGSEWWARLDIGNAS